MSPVGMNHAAEVWHVLQFSDALDLELASALSEFKSVYLWEPAPRLPLLPSASCRSERVHPASRLRLRSFPIVRGYARLPERMLGHAESALMACLMRQTPVREQSVLLCTTPFFAPIAERWPGPVIYWLSDLMAMYRRSASGKIRRLDRRMCRAATLVCPNSARIADYLRREAECPPDRCLVLPNATGARSLLETPLTGAVPLPAPYAVLPHPIAGIIGNLAENTDWVFLEQVIRRTPWLFYLFVGPADMPIRDRPQREARRRILRHPQACFTGRRPYTELYRFARGVDVAVLPYRRREPTYSGSSTRFYDHLAAGHPILATDHVVSLREQTPLLTLVGSVDDAVQVLEELRRSGFQDGLRQERWEASLQHTWQSRARTLVDALHGKLVSEAPVSA